MKRSILMFLVIGAAVIFFGCSEDNVLTPGSDNSDQVATRLKNGNAKIEFAGISTPVAVTNPGTPTVLPNGKTKIVGMVAEWYDDADNDYVKGQSIWYENWYIDADGSKAKVWGKADINPDIGGTWEVSWHGYIFAKEGYTIYNPEHPFTAVAYAHGTGKSGPVKGMVGDWKYEFDFDGNPETFFWAFTGSYH
jgi:hypothetical protein